MTVPQRTVVVLDALLACALGYLVAWHNLAPKYDVGVLLFGAALACPVFWRGKLSFSFFAALAVTAYFFRCVFLYVMGTDAVRGMACRDAALGLVAVGSVCAVKQIMRKHVQRHATKGCQESDRNEHASIDSGSGAQLIDQKAGATAQEVNGEEAVWSPPQFTLNALLVSTLACIGLLHVGAIVGLWAAFVTLLMGLFWFLIVGCVRLLSLGCREPR